MVSTHSRSAHDERDRQAAAGSGQSVGAASSPERPSPRKPNLFRHFLSSFSASGNAGSNSNSSSDINNNNNNNSTTSSSNNNNDNNIVKKQPSQHRNCCLSLMSRSFAAAAVHQRSPALQHLLGQQPADQLLSAKKGRRFSSESSNNQASSGGGHLVRMILNKNSAAEQVTTTTRRHSSESMLILLGSKRCPSSAINNNSRLSDPPEAAASSQPQAQLPQPQALSLLRQPTQQVSGEIPPPPVEQARSQVTAAKPGKRPSGRLVGALMPRPTDRGPQHQDRHQQQQHQQEPKLEQLIALLDRLARSAPESSVIAQPAPSGSSPAAVHRDRTTLASMKGGLILNPLYLESSWTELLQTSAVQWSSAEWANLRGQQDAIWEMLSTEAFYIQRIRVLVDLFLSTLLEVQRHSLLLEVDARRVLGNIDEVYAANWTFWNDHLLPMLEEARSRRTPLEPTLMRNAYSQLRSLFRPYYRYCWDYGACLRAVKELGSSNELFRVYMAWCESQKDCERLRLADLMAKPMQRLTRYPLLLKAILKRCERPEQSAALSDMVADTSRFVLSVDLELRKRDEARWLMQSERRIDSYEIGTDVYSDEVERLVRQRYSFFDLQAPLFRCRMGCQRQLLFDSSRARADGCSLGQLKFKDGQVSGKLDVVLLLFTDHLFVCKQTQAAGRSRPNATHSPLSGSLSPARNHTNAGALLRPPSNAGGSFQLYPRHAPTGRQWRVRTGSNSTVLGGRPSSLSPRASSLTLAPGAATYSASSQDLQYMSGNDGGSSGRLSASEDLDLPSRHASAQSLVGSAARDYFRRSAESSNSAEQIAERRRLSDCGLRSDADEAAPSRLRVIRAPYPVERLVVHELKGGSSLFCCQLNDARTVASSFVLYLSTGSEQAPTAPASANEPAERAGSVTTRRRWSDARWRYSQAHLSPAQQLVQLIRQAQVRYQTAASFHGVQLSDVANQVVGPADATEQCELSWSSAESRGAASGEQRLQRSRFSSWSSFRQSRRERRTRELAAADSADWPASVSSSEAPPSEGAVNQQPAAVGARQNSLAKAALEQQQAMLLNHGLYEQLAVTVPTCSGSTCDERNLATADAANVTTANADSQLPPTLLRTSGSQSSVFEDLSRNFASPVRQHLLSPSGYAMQQQQPQQQQQTQQLPQQQTPQQQPEAGMSATGSGRRHFSRSARVANNLELSSDTEIAAQNSSVTSSSSSTHSSLFEPSARVPPDANGGSRGGRSCADADCVWRRKSWHMVPEAPAAAVATVEPRTESTSCAGCTAPGSKTSPRRNLSSLRRQNVILSVSGEHQPAEQMVRRAHELSYATKLRALCLAQVQADSASAYNTPSDTTTTTTSGPSLSTSTATTNNSSKAQPVARDRKAGGSSQATTVDQMSVTFDDSNANELPERAPRLASETSDDQDSARATSFELGNLRGHRVAQVSLGEASANGGARSASMETSGRHTCVSVTLTLPNNDQSANSCALVGQDFCQHSEPTTTTATTSTNGTTTETSASLYLDIPGQRARCTADDQDELSPMPSSELSWTRHLTQAELDSCSSEDPAVELARRRHKLTLSLEPRSLERSGDSTCVDVPVLNVTNASPQNCSSSCEFPVNCFSNDYQQTHSRSSDLITARSQFSSPDWSAAGNEEPVRRATSANAIELNSSSGVRPMSGSGEESVHFLKRCQNYLRSHRPNRRLSKMSLMKATKIDLERSSRSQDSISPQFRPLQRQVSPQTGRLRLALSDAAASEQLSECDDLIDVNCLSNLVHPREQQSATGYLGFHEKLQLHNKMLMEEEKRREQRRRLTRSATGEIFDSLLRATSKVGGNAKRANDKSDT